MAKKKARKGGRKANQWSLIKFSDIAAFLAEHGLSQTDFAKAVGVTSSTFHNWKTNRCAPDEATQGKIAAVINGQEVSVPKKKKKSKTKKVTARGSRGAGSNLLAALGGGKPAKSKTAKVATKTKKVAKKRIGRVVRKPRLATSANGSANGYANGGLEGWNELKSLAKFLKANKKRTADDVKNVVEQINAARQLAELFA